MSLIRKTPRIFIPPKVKELVFERDGVCCKSCHKTPQQATLTIDHIIPLALGGSNDISNLQTLCMDCNRKKKDRLDPRFKRRFSK